MKQGKWISSDFYKRLLGDMGNKLITLRVVLLEEKIQEKNDMEIVGTQMVPYGHSFEVYDKNWSICL